MMDPAFVCGQRIGTMSGRMTSCPPGLMGPIDDGRAFRTLNILDEFSRECLAIRVKRRLNVDRRDRCPDRPLHPARTACLHSKPLSLIAVQSTAGHGPEFVAEAVRAWIEAVGAKTAFIEPGSPWENGYVESFNTRLRDELLDASSIR